MRRSFAGPRCTAAILAGGRGRRLGGADKGALVVGGRAILARQLAIVRQVTPRVAIVADEGARYAHLGVPVIGDEVAGAGPLGGIAAALAWSDEPHCLIVACDMPFLSAAFLEHLLMRVGDADVALARTAEGRDHPLCAVYARTLLPIVRARLQAGRLEVTALVREARTVIIGAEELAPFDPGQVMLSNVNTPQDLEQACAWAAAEGHRTAD